MAVGKVLTIIITLIIALVAIFVLWKFSGNLLSFATTIAKDLFDKFVKWAIGLITCSWRRGWPIIGWGC